MKASLSRAKRKRIERLQDEVDLVLDGDRRFFERHRDRNHRLRLAGQAEIEMLAEVHGPGEVRLPPGTRLYVVVRQIEEGARIRYFIPNDADLDTDIPEGQARWLFEHFAPAGSQAAKAEASVRNALAKRRMTP